jgi:hypothetical protein
MSGGLCLNGNGLHGDQIAVESRVLTDRILIAQL